MSLSIKNGTTLSGALLLSLALSVSSAWAAKPGPPGGHLTITEVSVAFGPPDVITITGTDFGFGPEELEVTLGEFGPLALMNSNDTMIQAELPGGLIAGDYLLIVSRGNGQSQNDEYDLTIGAVGPQGPEGPAGPGAGDFSTEVIFVSGSVSPLKTEFFLISCKPNQVVTGGGFGTGSSGDLTVFQNRPAAATVDQRSWVV